MKGGYRFRERQKREWLINLNKTELIVVRNTVIELHKQAEDIELQSAMKTIALNSSLKVSYQEWLIHFILEKLKNVKNLKAKQIELENAMKARREKETASQKFKHLNEIWVLGYNYSVKIAALKFKKKKIKIKEK